MNSEEYQEIIQFLREQKYPELQKKPVLLFHCRIRHTFQGEIYFLNPKMTRYTNK